MSETSHGLKRFEEVHFYLDRAVGIAQYILQRLIIFAGIPSSDIVAKTRSTMRLSKAAFSLLEGSLCADLCFVVFFQDLAWYEDLVYGRLAALIKPKASVVYTIHL